MSYDLEVRSKPPYGEGVPIEQVASLLLSLPGLIRTDSTSFALDRPDAGLNLSIVIGYQSSEEDEDDEPGASPPKRVNLASFLVPYPVLDKTGPVALEMAFQMAERLNWSVYDPQS